MKTQSFSKSIITLAFTLVCGLVANAASPRNYLYDTKEENGLITSKTIFLQDDNGMLDKQVKYEFVYNEAGKVSVKKAYRWNVDENKWLPFYQTTYAYDDKKQMIESNYGMWNQKTKQFDLNMQTLSIPASNYNEIFS